MKKSNLLIELTIACVTIAPLLYFAIIWDTLPSTIPIHFDAQGNPNNYGSKVSMAVILFMITIGIGLFLKFIPRIDKQKNFNVFQKTYFKLRLILAFFFCAMGFIIIDSIKTGSTSTSSIFIILAFLIAIIGNYMSNIRTNYFIGIRTPWTLNNDLVWKKTHFITGRLWFIGGLFLALLIMLLPQKALLATFLIILTVLVVYPFTYSYIIYKKQSNS